MSNTTGPTGPVPMGIRTPDDIEGAPCAVSTARSRRRTADAARGTTPSTRGARASGTVALGADAERNNAAARLRRIIERKARAWCDWCREDFAVVDVDVDHVRPLSMGGTDTDGNVQVLCRGCHRFKTSTEFGAAGSCRTS
ncbi:HNH endonuclease [Streptomyces hydrogenans]|uniref:HNH endonuclease n=1 Tax=Streptomyces hydrogenans TaxID=1873719 RepID=UPI0036B3C0B5